MTTDRRTKEDYYTIFLENLTKRYQYVCLQVLDDELLNTIEIGDILVYVV